MRYRPSNGTEGVDFMARFCDRCVKDDPDKGVFCDILARTMVFEITDPDYPDEWRAKDRLDPSTWECTAFVKIGRP